MTATAISRDHLHTRIRRLWSPTVELKVIDLPYGWEHLVSRLIDNLIDFDGASPAGIRLTVLEPDRSTGLLDIRAHNVNTNQHEFINVAIDLSGVTCAVCGDPGDFYDAPVGPDDPRPSPLNRMTVCPTHKIAVRRASRTTGMTVIP